MIYLDAHAKEDTEELPKNRGKDVPCINCGQDWWEHYNWSCKTNRTSRADRLFSALAPSDRYLTRSMADSLGSCQPGIPQLELPKRTAKPDEECPCHIGILRSQCDFHRDP